MAMHDKSDVQALVVWPSAPLTNRLVSRALSKLNVPVVTTLPAQRPKKLIQWSTYDVIDHELTLFSGADSVLSSSYIIRKALIRKHYLSRSIRSYTTKRPASILHKAFPKTWEIELTYADELDEFWADDLYDLGEELDSAEGRWYILKPGMADRGMGIRMFNSKDALRNIFEEFEGASDDEDEDEEDGDGSASTAVVTSQLRHFVVQEYLMNPLLVDPSQSLANAGTIASGEGHKFHLRVYCVASGDMKLYMWTDILALFSSAPYSAPAEEDEIADLAKHLTNTSLQTDRGEAGVRLLSELVGSQIQSGLSEDRVLTQDDITKIVDQASAVLAETFVAALASPVHFQALPNAFELFGIDLLVTDDAGTSELGVHLLEVNAEPAIELTGARLTWILEDLFEAIAKECVGPFIGVESARRDGRLRECIHVSVRGPHS